MTDDLPPSPLAPDKPVVDARGDGRPLLGIDLGGTNMQIGVVSADGRVLSRAKNRTKAEEGRDAVLDRMAAGAREACEQAGVRLEDVSAVGIGVPGPVDARKGVVFEAVNLRWDAEPVADLMEERLRTPVTLDNDVNVAAWGEYIAGAGRGSTDMLACWLGTGVGGGLVLNGTLHYGHFYTAGEFGHVICDRNAPMGVRKVEQQCSRTAVANRVRQLIESNEQSAVWEITGGKLEKIKSKVLAQAYQQGDALVTDVVHDVADRLAVYLSGTVTLLSLDRIVLGGGLTEAIGQPLVERVRREIRKWVFPDICRGVTVVASELEDNAGVVGAAMLARDRAAPAAA